MKGAIFDMDGTLIDSMHAWDNISERYLEDIGIVPPENLRQTLLPLSMSQTADFLRELGAPHTKEEIRQRVNDLAFDQYLLHVPAKAGSIEFLSQLAADGVRMCILTASDRKLAEAALERLGMSQYFEFVSTCSEEGLSKHDPELFELTLARLGCDKCDTVVFEDALHAVTTAKNAGFRVVAIADDSSAGVEQEIRAIADQFITHYSELEVVAL